jgi:hypothetical protein
VITAKRTLRSSGYPPFLSRKAIFDSFEHAIKQTAENVTHDLTPLLWLEKRNLTPEGY